MHDAHLANFLPAVMPSREECELRQTFVACRRLREGRCPHCRHHFSMVDFPSGAYRTTSQPIAHNKSCTTHSAQLKVYQLPTGNYQVNNPTSQGMKPARCGSVGV